MNDKNSFEVVGDLGNIEVLFNNTPLVARHAAHSSLEYPHENGIHASLYFDNLLDFACAKEANFRSLKNIDAIYINLSDSVFRYFSPVRASIKSNDAPPAICMQLVFDRSELRDLCPNDENINLVECISDIYSMVGAYTSTLTKRIAHSHIMTEIIIELESSDCFYGIINSTVDVVEYINSKLENSYDELMYFTNIYYSQP